eukprot:c6024_g1_i1.p2 GENE.c6024_g1_i1~~c6024_g1_i1.p2  ORF type:complete len:245 (+),score=48.29 c6024_g1_i1:124-858(+)
MQAQRLQSLVRSIRAFGTRPMDTIDHLLENNVNWVKKMQSEDKDFFTRLGKGQRPPYLWIGCSDSRVPANQILGLEPGSVFVHRNVGNLLPVSDINSLSVVEFAVDHLDVKHIMVTGHYDCGAINASLQAKDRGLIESWLRNIRDVHRLHNDELAGYTDHKKLARRLVELNVVEQCLNLYKTGVVQRKRLQTRKDVLSGVPGAFVYPRVHALVFDPSEGILRKLPIDVNQHLKQYAHIYNLVDE